MVEQDAHPSPADLVDQERRTGADENVAKTRSRQISAGNRVARDGRYWFARMEDASIAPHRAGCAVRRNDEPARHLMNAVRQPDGNGRQGAIDAHADNATSEARHVRKGFGCSKHRGSDTTMVECDPTPLGVGQADGNRSRAGKDGQAAHLDSVAEALRAAEAQLDESRQARGVNKLSAEAPVRMLAGLDDQY